MKIKALILPHFEIGEMYGDAAGEAQLYYEEYLMQSEEYEIPGGYKLYYNKENGVALSVTGSGKVNTAACLTAILCDKRFEFDEAYIIGVGCGGGDINYSVLGDVCLMTSAVDFDLGHTADIRDLTVEGNTRLWYHDKTYDDVSHKHFNRELIDRAYSLTKSTKLETTEFTEKFMRENFPGVPTIKRKPRVIRGTVVSGDNYWKGKHSHEKCQQIVDCYGCAFPFAITEMEDVVIADVAAKFSMLDRVIIIRVNVNTDIFKPGETPELLWDTEETYSEKVGQENTETLDIFPVAMENHFRVGKIIIDAIIEGKI